MRLRSAQCKLYMLRYQGSYTLTVMASISAAVRVLRAYLGGSSLKGRLELDGRVKDDASRASTIGCCFLKASMLRETSAAVMMNEKRAKHVHACTSEHTCTQGIAARREPVVVCA